LPEESTLFRFPVQRTKIDAIAGLKNKLDFGLVLSQFVSDRTLNLGLGSKRPELGFSNKQAYRKVSCLIGRPSVQAQVRQLATEVQRRFSCLDVLLNNAGAVSPDAV